jgi:uncharacterized delta-60 repeat protein
MGLAVRSDARVVAVTGTAPVSAERPSHVLQIAADGTKLDTSFGAGTGAFTFADGFEALPYTVPLVLQSDGKSLVAGDCVLPTTDGGTDPSFRACIARVTATGALDTSYGTNGIARIDIGADTTFTAAITLDAQGRALVTGRAKDASSDESAFLARLTTGGALDTSFAGGVRVIKLHTTPTGYDEGVGVGVQSSGRIVVLEQRSDQVNGAIVGDWVVIGAQSDGTPDPAFGDGAGIKVIDFGFDDLPSALSVGADDSIFLAGIAVDHDTSRHDAAFAMIDSNGALHASFGQGGKTRYSAANGDWLYPSAPARVGTTLYVPVLDDVTGTPDVPTIFKVLANGALDPTFGAAGVGHLPWMNGSYRMAAAAGAGEIVVGGQSQPLDGGAESAIVVRLVP